MPRHLRKVTNRDNPIALDDSDDDEASKPNSALPRQPVTAKQNAQAGPSRLNPISAHDDSVVYALDPLNKNVGPALAHLAGWSTLLQAKPPASIAGTPYATLTQETMTSDFFPDFTNHQPAEKKSERDSVFAFGAAGPSSHAATTPTTTTPGAAGAHQTPSGTGSPRAQDPYDKIASLLPLVLDVLPDIDAEWVLDQLKTRFDVGGKILVGIVGRVLEDAFNMDEGYPKAVEKAVSKHKEVDKADVGYEDPAYRKEERSGFVYWERSVAALQDHFLKMPVTQ